ncbi:hypothetical protein FHX41_4973 [Actinomadura hallensis]|uniref:DUF2975 family protein n=1 Tax=Actinomadura hallensis TaxID=337895 RepID=A0A543IKW2_9ACTN|nr:DUF2975 domain-containing protein [Actinomadura hallensis]TQM71216.1 hypothetical protein FHX41_4973 [Actinomadura hallensis]
MQATTWWRRLDRHSLELIIGLALLGVGLSVLFPLLGVVGLIPPQETREVTLNSDTEVTAPSGDGVSLSGTRQAELTVDDPGLLDRVLLAGPGIVQGVLVLVVLTLLMQIALTFSGSGEFFVRRNTRRLYTIAVGLLLIATVVPALEVVTTTALVSGTPVEQAVVITYRLSGVTVLLSFLAVALAGAFAHGTRLRADTEGLV